jgi:peptide deformylase
MLKIVTYPNKILRKKAQEIENVLDPKIQELAKGMIKAMGKGKGIGLAAPQVGKSLSLITIDFQDNPLVLFNPKINFFSKKKEEAEEGCLSLPKQFGQVERSHKVRVKAVDSEGKKIKFKAEGLFARVLQHEIDHLNGILIIDKFEK